MQIHISAQQGDIAGVVREIANGVDIDCLQEDDLQTPLMYALKSPNAGSDMIRFLLQHGANVNAFEPEYGQTPLMYAIENNRVEVLQWLIDEGCDVEATDDFDNTALMMAAERGATDCVRILLEAGVNTGRANNYEGAIEMATNLEIVRMLVASGEDLSDINDNMRGLLTGINRNTFSLSKLSPQQYFADKNRRFGRTNPELMEIPFWQAMIREDISAYTAKQLFYDTKNWQDSTWCYQRFGRTITQLPDGRIIEIAGEHEDSYDPDFCIYNDVVVYQGDGNFQIFGYPEDVFPPTDFHSATLIGKYIYIIGNLGYVDARRYYETPVYRLHCHTLKIDKIETTGDKPGWISRHKAYYKEPNQIYISGGLINDKKSKYIDNSVDYILDLIKLTWSRVSLT